ncbi:putative toxin-antitoxin system toxin component, PIN family [Pseudoxanthomonas sp. CAU 1598]|uniref:Toxin-antitoxin system toxin component, PIN family n=1 Tax=Pseudomarimonas arenosa TaxID=2774145 RepID=A0AAW3ZK36_9GAMM|nr:putative toxin-antitoxin system toxin component, PIN family [Pseudomarimonas arenosa]
MIDSNVWLDLLLFKDPRCAALRLAIERGDLQPLSNADCQSEWLRVLHYPALSLSDDQRAGLITAQADWVRLIASADTAGPRPANPRCRDPDDQKFLDLAVEQRANFLFSRDRALLRLSRRCQNAFQLWIGVPQDWPTDHHARLY